MPTSSQASPSPVSETEPAPASASASPPSGVRPRRPGAIPVRNPAIPIEGVTKHWFGGHVLATHVANGVNLLVPAGERFFVRSVRAYLPRIEDPALREAIRGFFGQEGSHAHEHERYFETMKAHGLPIERYLAAYEALAYGVIEKAMSPAMRLSMTAALEHITATMAEQALRTRILDEGDAPMRALLLWHAAEEIEHRAVAYDVLQAFEPGYGLRVAGLAAGIGTLFPFWLGATLFLLWHDGATLRETWASERTRSRRFGRFAFLPGIRAYLRRDFHPSQSPIDGLAAEFIREAGMS